MESNYCPASIQKDFRFSMEALKVIFRNCAFGSRRALKSPNSSHGKWVDGFKLDLTVEKALSSLLLGPNLGVANGTSLISRYNNCQLQSRPGIKRSVRNQTPSLLKFVLRTGLIFLPFWNLLDWHVDSWRRLKVTIVCNWVEFHHFALLMMDWSRRFADGWFPDNFEQKKASSSCCKLLESVLIHAHSEGSCYATSSEKARSLSGILATKKKEIFKCVVCRINS